MKIPTFWIWLCRLVITRQSRRNLLLSFATFHTPQNNRCIYTDCRSAATVHLEYTYHCWVCTLKWTLDSYSCIKEGSGRQRTGREGSEHHTSGAVHRSRYIKLHVPRERETVQGKTTEFAYREWCLARGTSLFCSHCVTFCRNSHRRVYKSTPIWVPLSHGRHKKYEPNFLFKMYRYENKQLLNG
jgi:hypothetical protein